MIIQKLFILQFIYFYRDSFYIPVFLIWMILRDIQGIFLMVSGKICGFFSSKLSKLYLQNISEYITKTHMFISWCLYISLSGYA